MTTHSYSAPMVNTSDAEFRAWGLALSDALTTAGFPKSPDTGQIDWATATRSGTSFAASGYEIRYINDSLHGTKPCYVKLEFGRTNDITRPLIYFSAGTGTNGAGTLTGVMLTRVYSGLWSAPLAGSYPTYICVKEGYVAFTVGRNAWAANSGDSLCFFSVARMCDASGTPTNTGFVFLNTWNNSGTVLTTRTTFLTSEVYDGSSFAFFPGANTTTLVGADVQVIRHFGYQPTIRCIPFFLSYIASEIGDQSTFTATPVGVTPRTYLALTTGTVPGQASATGNAIHKLAMQYD